VRAANLALKFGVELAAIAALGYWGATRDGEVVPVLAAVAAPLLVAGLWGVLAAPRSPRRLSIRARVPFELAIFALAVAALLASASSLTAAIFASAVVLNAALLTRFDQWES
jgi:hypothetical protein